MTKTYKKLAIRRSRRVTVLALIGGTGLNQLSGFEIHAEHRPATPWGELSQPILEGRYAACPLYFLARHGIPHHIAPHRINYQANIWALRELGVESIIAVNAVGGILQSQVPGHIVIPDQIVDYTWGREHTFFDGIGRDLQHIDFTEPYNGQLREQLITAAESVGAGFSASGTYGVTQGPRLETAAEIRRLRQDGCDIVGMTGMPEAALAAELGLAYAALCMVVNAAAGLGEEPITEAAMRAILAGETVVIGELLSACLQQWN
jgi:5'-methylthioinosine phosphorylase